MRGCLALALLSSLAALAPRAHAEDVEALLKVALDSGARVQEREAALDKAVHAVSMTKAPRSGPLRDQLKPLLQELRGKASDGRYDKLARQAIIALDLYQPFPDVGPLMKPFLEKSDDGVKATALHAIALHGATGVAGDLEALVSRPASDETGREAVDRAVVDAARGTTPAGDSARVLTAALERSRYRSVKHAAVSALGDLRHQDAKAALVKAAALETQDEEVACAAALALVRHGDLSGVGEIVKRSQRRCSAAVYRTLCEAAFLKDGFAGVRPEKLYSADAKDKAKVAQAIKDWWDAARTRSPEELVFAAIKARGVDVPKDTQSKEAVSALIEGLDLDPRSLRYSVLDLLVRLTGQTERAADFKVLKTSLGGGGEVALREAEPQEGFDDDARAEALKKEQHKKVDAWREWWRKAAPGARLVNGTWKTD